MTVDFEKLTPGQLGKAAIVPQVLDGQWTPRKLLPEMIRDKKGLKDIKSKRKKHIRKEWRRALVYGEQVVINRAYIVNNDIVVDDYNNKANRQHFKRLLNDRVIVPYLLYENSPDERPRFDIDEKRWKAWLSMLKDTYPACVRLNWADQKADLARMGSAFHRYIKSLDTPNFPENLAAYLGIPQEGVDAFKKRVFDVVDYATKVGREGEFVTRNMLYLNFVTAPGTPVDEGKYGNGPFSADLKQIFDLKYNVNLPDAMGRYALTPEDSLPRSALGDLDETLQTQIITNENVQDILYALRQLNFEKIAQGLYINSLANLSLSDVIEIRKMGEWGEYIRSIHDLLANSLAFTDSSKKVYVKFEALNRAISKMREGKFKTKWEPWVKLTIAVGLSAVELWINPADMNQKLLTKLGTGAVAAGFTPFIMRMTISAFNRKNNADLDVSIDFMHRTVQNGQDTWNEIYNQLKLTPGFKLLEKSVSDIIDANQSSPQQKKDG